MAKTGKNSKNPSEKSSTDVGTQDIEKKNNKPPKDQAKLPKKKFSISRIKNRFKSLPRKRKITLTGALASLLLVILIVAIPASRFAVLNIFSAADVTIELTDNSTGLPVSGAVVTLQDGTSATSDINGLAFFNDAPYGNNNISVTQESYESATFDITISNDDSVLGPFNLVSIGTPVEITVTDWLNNQAVLNAVATDEQGAEYSAVDDTITYLVPPQATEEIVLTVSADGFNPTTLIIETVGSDGNRLEDSELQSESVQLVQSGRHYFISDREGDIDFYSSNYDGFDVKKVVSTDQKSDNFNYLPVPDRENTYVALLSSTNVGSDRDQVAVVDLNSETIEIVDEAPNQELRFSFIDSSYDRVLYGVYYEDGRPVDNKVKSLELENNRLLTLAESGEYMSVVYDEVRGNAYIINNVNNWPAPASYSFFVVDLPSNTRTDIDLTNRVQSMRILESQPDRLIFYRAGFQTEDGWYALNLSNSGEMEYLGKSYPDFEEADEIPDSEKGQASPSGQNRVWIDRRDGKDRLILKETSNVVNGDNSSLSVFSIIRWVDDNTLTVTGTDGIETADYIIDVTTGNYQKITNTFRQSYYR